MIHLHTRTNLGSIPIHTFTRDATISSPHRRNHTQTADIESARPIPNLLKICCPGAHVQQQRLVFSSEQTGHLVQVESRRFISETRFADEIPLLPVLFRTPKKIVSCNTASLIIMFPFFAAIFYSTCSCILH